MDQFLDRTSSSIGPVPRSDQFLDQINAIYSILLYLVASSTDYVRHPSVAFRMTLNLNEIAILFKYLLPKVGFLCSRHNNQAAISYQYSILGHIQGKMCVHQEYRSPTNVAVIRILKWMSSACDDNVNAVFLTRENPRLDNCSCHNWTSDPHNGYATIRCV